jgi:hypothetical protein
MSEQQAANINSAPLRVSAALGDFFTAARDPSHPYHEVADVLVRAYTQAAAGKGHDRHGKDDIPFRDQRMQTIAQGQGHSGGMVYQICKKAEEAEGLPTPAAVHEYLGCIIYACGTVLFRETQAKKEQSQ